jgi:hypothetical protein
MGRLRAVRWPLAWEYAGGPVCCSSFRSTIAFNGITIDDETEHKLWFEHEQLTQLDIEEALDNLEGEARWDLDPDHGGRVIALGFCEARGHIFVSLSPLDLERGTWSVISAFDCTPEYWARVTEGMP